MLWLGLLVTYYRPKPPTERERALMASRIAELERLNRALVSVLTKINEGK